MASELYQLRISGTNQHEYNECVVACQGDNLAAGDIIANALDLLASFENNVLSNWLSMLPASCQVRRLTAKRIDSSAGGVEVVKQFQEGDNPGGVAGTSQTTQLCPIVRLIPPMGVKSAGRFFLAAIAETDISPSGPASGWITRLAALMNTWVLTDFGSGSISWQLAIYSKLLDQHHLVQDFDTSPIIGWQMKRKRPY